MGVRLSSILMKSRLNFTMFRLFLLYKNNKELLVQNKLRETSLGTDSIEYERFGLIFTKTIIFTPKTRSINSGTGTWGCGQSGAERGKWWCSSSWSGTSGQSVKCVQVFTTWWDSSAKRCQIPVLQIQDILVWIRIRIRGSMPLTNGSGSCYFRHWPSRCQEKLILFFYFFCLLLFEGR